ncbi:MULTISPECIES: hypothetical protein [Clostridium]|uniref:Uncharacterized protein n=1 Tax=Clostridium brassicae TaxID=2999072 RepID=A0ABT4DCS9_9CLOT|nr:MULTISPECIES: hypothetical protein [Clostridium]MCY6958951.1 hypothetical protein [Clostridium brassicae]WMJ80617.1 hypothetical protein RBU49_17720 [Clostridium sp. MB40-C1]
MKNSMKYKIYDRIIVTNNVEKRDLILGDFSPKIKLWKFKDNDELRLDFTVKAVQLLQIKGNGKQDKCMKNKPIKLFQEYMDKKGTVRLKEIESSMTEEDGSYNFDVLIQEKYFPKYYTVLIKI